LIGSRQKRIDPKPTYYTAREASGSAHTPSFLANTDIYCDLTCLGDTRHTSSIDSQPCSSRYNS
jgi:hypothetical protein